MSMEIQSVEELIMIKTTMVGMMESYGLYLLHR